MRKKVIAAAAIVALKEALSKIYWYKADLRSFLTNCLSNPAILSRVDWNDYKRNIVAAVVDRLAANEDQFQSDLLRLMSEVARIEDFPHLLHLDDGAEKAKQARAAVLALRKLIKPHEDVQAEEEAAEARRKVSYEQSLKNAGVKTKLEELTKVYFKLLTSDQPQRRGYHLEKVMRELFILFDLDPKASFKIVGEQIDGAFTFDGTDY